MSTRSSIKSSKSRERTLAKYKYKGTRGPSNRMYVGVRSTNAATQGSSAVANKQVVKLRYTTLVPLTNTGTGLGVTYQFRANSIFDPDFSGTGHQPMGHDEWAKFYLHYRVLKSSISVQIEADDAATQPYVQWVGVGAASGTASINPTTVIERQKAAWKVSGVGTTPAGPLINWFDGKRFFGAATQNGDTCKAAFGANPTEDVFFQIGQAPLNTAATARTLFSLVVIDYWCELTEPQSLLES